MNSRSIKLFDVLVSGNKLFTINPQLGLIRLIEISAVYTAISIQMAVVL